MIYLQKLPKPSVLVKNAGQWTKAYVALVKAKDDVPNTLATRYKHPDVKTEVTKETNGKCAYCESSVTHTYPGDVEHILAKVHRPDLYVEWTNLTFACFRCNNSKRDYHSTATPLLNPFQDDPLTFLLFVGPMVLPKAASDRGQVTVFRLDLNRAPLLERRAECLDGFQKLIDSWARATAKARKEVLREMIDMEMEDGSEFAQMRRTFWAMLYPDQ